MPVFTETSTMAEHIKQRRPLIQFPQSIISESDPNPHPQIPSIMQSTRCKSTISSLLLSNNKKKNNFSSSTFRGLGCTASSSQQVSVPAVIRISADWEGKKTRKKKQNKSKNKSHQGMVDGRSNLNLNSGGCVDFQDVLCGPGIGFSSDAADSVDCVVARKNVSGRGKIDGEKMSQRERSYLARRGGNPETFSFLDSDPDLRPLEVFGTRYHRHVRHPSPDGLAEIMMFQSSLLMGRRLDMSDQFSDLRLDVDNMSYEELLELGDRIGYVNTGLKEDEIGRCVRKIKPSVLYNLSSHFSTTQADKKCSICQEEYEEDDETGKLECGHSFHVPCIKQWLARKNACPVCKTAVTVRC